MANVEQLIEAELEGIQHTIDLMEKSKAKYGLNHDSELILEGFQYAKSRFKVVLAQIKAGEE